MQKKRNREHSEVVIYKRGKIGTTSPSGAAKDATAREVINCSYDTIESIPWHVLGQCIGWLSAVEISTTVRRVSKKWYQLSRGNNAWSEIWRRVDNLRRNGIFQVCDGLELLKLDELTEEGFNLAVETYNKLFASASQSCRESLSRTLDEVINLEPNELESWWWKTPKPSFRIAKKMWNKIHEDPSIRTVSVGEDHIEGHFTSRSFSEFQCQVGELWVLDLYIAMGFLPNQTCCAGSNCLCLGFHSLETLITAERRISTPKHIILNSPNHHNFCSGKYEQMPALVNGFPYWYLKGTGGAGSSSWLYSSPIGIWTFTNCKGDFETGAGHVTALTEHSGLLPQCCREWLYGDGTKWIQDRTISVRGSNLRPKFLKNQKSVTPRMRSIVIGWLSDIQSWQKASLPTLFLAAELTDRYLEQVLVEKYDLQLVACSAMVIANQIEGVLVLGGGDHGTSQVDRMHHLSEECYSKEQIQQKAEEIITVLGPEAARYPTPQLFLDKYLEFMRDVAEAHAVPVDDASHYACEMALLHYEIISKYPASVVAAASLLVACRVLAVQPPDHISQTGIDVEICAASLIRIFSSARPWTSYKKNLHEKYRVDSRGRVSELFDSLAEVPTDDE